MQKYLIQLKTMIDPSFETILALSLTSIENNTNQTKPIYEYCMIEYSRTILQSAKQN